MATTLPKYPGIQVRKCEDQRHTYLNVCCRQLKQCHDFEQRHRKTGGSVCNAFYKYFMNCVQSVYEYLQLPLLSSPKISRKDRLTVHKRSKICMHRSSFKFNAHHPSQSSWPRCGGSRGVSLLVDPHSIFLQMAASSSRG